MFKPDVQPFKARCNSGHAPETQSGCVRDECNFREFQRSAGRDQKRVAGLGCWDAVPLFLFIFSFILLILLNLLSIFFFILRLFPSSQRLRFLKASDAALKFSEEAEEVVSSAPPYTLLFLPLSHFLFLFLFLTWSLYSSQFL